MRWRIDQVAGKVVRHAGALLLKVEKDLCSFLSGHREQRTSLLMCHLGIACDQTAQASLISRRLFPKRQEVFSEEKGENTGKTGKTDRKLEILEIWSE